jgi:hypothetical protein
MPGVSRRTSLVGLLLFGFALAACGAGRDQAMPVVTGARAQRLVAASAGRTEAEKTAKLSGQVTVDAGGHHVTMPIDGAIDFRTNAVELSMGFGQLGAAADGMTMKVRVIAGVAYMSLGSIPGAARGVFEQRMQGKHWIKIDPSNLGASPDAGSTTFGGDAGSTIGALRGVDDVTRVGTEEVAGVPTTHYRGTVDLAKVLAKLPARMQDELRKNPAFGTGAWKIDAWVDADGTLRKMAFDVETAQMRVSEVLELRDFGAPVDLSAPPADDVIDFATVFGDLLGGSNAHRTT